LCKRRFATNFTAGRPLIISEEPNNEFFVTAASGVDVVNLDFTWIALPSTEPPPSPRFTPQFLDAGDTGTWAQDALAWAVYTGLITGTGEGVVLP